MQHASEPFSIRAAGADDLPRLRALLSAAALPVDDLERADVRLWLMEDADGATVGCAGLEGTGPDVLLRSLVVAPARRGRGCAALLVDHAGAAAAESGAARLWALTQTAERWFLAQGWQRTARPDAPAAIRATAQFSGICPASAVLLTRSVPVRHAPERPSMHQGI
ncbi:tyrosine phosphatase [Caenispirillum salinarum AK4]|uniref:Tyrosine phosphatase n=1 Tax=Caenispirillum salinarum AK4 TaxID=1238182 RepID=K9H766_9PROT|nr:arsenic resistance N-acetyltransferase ArsN2 [Caenispirillum salinarum]EKV32929.1 tyrosine phosphatase [Caenispirillum salinarum AK4]